MSCNRSRISTLVVVIVIFNLFPAALAAVDFIKQFNWTGRLESGKPFTVYFDYHLESAPSATVRLFFWTPIPKNPSVPEESTCVGEVEVTRGEGRGYIQAFLDPVWARTEFSRLISGVGFEFSLDMGPVSSGKFVLLLEGVNLREGPWPVEVPRRPVRVPLGTPPGDLNVNVNVHVYIHHDGEGKPEKKEQKEDDSFFVFRDLASSDLSLYEYHIRLENPVCPQRADPEVDPDFVPPDIIKCPPVEEKFWEIDASGTKGNTTGIERGSGSRRKDSHSAPKPTGDDPCVPCP